MTNKRSHLSDRPGDRRNLPKPPPKPGKKSIHDTTPTPSAPPRPKKAEPSESARASTVQPAPDATATQPKTAEREVAQKPKAAAEATKRTPLLIATSLAAAFIVAGGAIFLFSHRNTEPSASLAAGGSSDAQTASDAPPASNSPSPSRTEASVNNPVKTGGSRIDFEEFAANIADGQTSWIARSRELVHEGYRFRNLENPLDPLDPDSPGIPYAISISRNPLPGKDEVVALEFHYKGRSMELSGTDDHSFDLASIDLYLNRNRNGAFTVTGYRNGEPVEEFTMDYRSFDIPMQTIRLDWTDIDRVVFDAYREKGGALPKLVSISLRP